MLLLLAAGASVTDTDTNGWTPLHFASRSDPSAVEALLAAGADPMARAVDGSTPLHHVVEYGNSNVAPLLLARGASATAKNVWGASPLDMALVEAGKAPNDDDMEALVGFLMRAAAAE